MIPHGAFDYLTRLPEEEPLPPELAASRARSSSSSACCGPTRASTILLDAFAGLDGAELWIVGRPRMDVEPLRGRGRARRGTVRFVARFVAESEIPAFFRRADVVALPYRDIDQSGVLYTALAFGKPIVLLGRRLPRGRRDRRARSPSRRATRRRFATHSPR